MILVYEHAAVVGVKARLYEICGGGRDDARTGAGHAQRDYVVLLAAEDLEAMEATLEQLSDPEAMDRVRRSEAEVIAGDVLGEAAVRALVQRAGG